VHSSAPGVALSRGRRLGVFLPARRSKGAAELHPDTIREAPVWPLHLLSDLKKELACNRTNALRGGGHLRQSASCPVPVFGCLEKSLRVKVYIENEERDSAQLD